jgi:PhnB protein
MKPKVTPIPKGFHTVTPYLIIKDAARAIDFYNRAFGAQERLRLPMPDGRVGHAELTIGDSIVMLADEFPEFGHQSPQSLKGTPVGFAIYLPDVDRAFQRAIEAGATVKEPVADKFYGDRSGTVMDPFGHKWTLMTHIEDVPPAEMKKRMDTFCAHMAEHKQA